MTERVVVKILTFKVEIKLYDKTPKGMPDYADGGVYDDLSLDKDHDAFKIWFSFARGIPTLQTLVHECWHLYMTILSHVDNHEHTFEELNNEVYAYCFQDIFHTVFNAVICSKTYKRLADEDDRNKQQV